MRIENNSPKYNNSVIEKQPKISTATSIPAATSTKTQSFKGVGNVVVNTMDAIERGGLVASFLVQDFLGMNIPRTATGLYRNTDRTGELNYMEAAEVGIREFLSGPVMFAVPMGMLWAGKRLFGKANDVQVNVLRAMGDKFAASSAGKTAADFSDMKTVKQSFYSEIFEDILTNAYGENAKNRDIAKEARQFATDVLEYEELSGNKETKKAAKEKMAKMVSDFAEITKKNASTPSQNFLAARLTTTENPVEKPLSKLITDMRNFTEDAVESVIRKAQKGALDGKELKDFFKHFTDIRTGSRVLANFSMILGIIAFCSYIPKLYQLSDENPALHGLEGDKSKDKDKNKTTNNQNTNKSDDKLTTDKAKPIAFKGAIDKLGKIASKKDGKLAKFFSEFEFDSYNCSFLGLLTACGLGVLVPRLYHAREENEYKEVLFRDSVTIGTIACGAKIMQQIVARMCTNATGFALAIKPKFKEGASNLSKTLSYLRPVKGHQVMTSEQLKSKYTNIDTYKNGIADFAQFIDEQGGDVRKMFTKTDKKATELLQNIYNTSEKAASVEFGKTSNKDLIEGLMDVIKNGKSKEELEKLYAIFKDDKNAFLKKAKMMNSGFNFAIIFGVSPIILGCLIPLLNESLTKKRQHAKHNSIENGNNVQQPQNDNKNQLIKAVTSLNPLESRAAVTFKEFLKQ